jgi:2-phosphosulfolactate phosphatase
MKIETILTPAELPALAQRDLRATACVVFDVLRATSTFVTALHHGAKAIIPVSEITVAVAIRKRLRQFAATHFGPHAGYSHQYLSHFMRTRS